MEAFSGAPRGFFYVPQLVYVFLEVLVGSEVRKFGLGAADTKRIIKLLKLQAVVMILLGSDEW